MERIALLKVAGEVLCPVCQRRLFRRELGEFAVQECPSGHGSFLPRAEIGRPGRPRIRGGTQHLPRVAPYLRRVRAVQSASLSD